MKKWNLLILMALLMIIPAIAIDECKPVTSPSEVPCMITSTWAYTNCSAEIMQVYNFTGGWVNNFSFSDFGITTLCNTSWNITMLGSYNYVVTNGDSGEIIIEVIDTGTSMAVTIFLIIINLIILGLPLFKYNFTKNQITNLIIRRCCFLLGIYLAVLNTTIMFNLSETAGLGISKELIFYLNLFGWAGYLFMIYLVIKTIIDVLIITRNVALKKRLGEDIE